jgi:hypothetical protein
MALSNGRQLVAAQERLHCGWADGMQGVKLFEQLAQLE